MSVIRRCLAASVFLLAGVSAFGKELKSSDTIVIPGAPLKSFDIGFAANGLYALADRSNASIDLIDTKTDRFVGRISGFTGAKDTDHAGPNGIVITGNRLWAGDGESDVKLVDLATRATLATVSTDGKNRVDELAYDPRDHLVIAANNADDPPFVTFISARAPYQVTSKLTLPQATDGIEQPVWDAKTQKVYLAVPTLNGQKEDGGIAEIDPRKGALERIMHVSRCMPAGLAAGPDGQLLVGCSNDAVDAGFAAKSMLLDPRTGKITKTYVQVGGSDEVWYDRTTGRYALAAVANPGGPVIGFIDAHTHRWIGNVPSGQSAHSVAGDGKQFFVPLAAGDAACPNGCVKVIR